MKRYFTVFGNTILLTINVKSHIKKYKVKQGHTDNNMTKFSSLAPDTLFTKYMYIVQSL